MRAGLLLVLCMAVFAMFTPYMAKADDFEDYVESVARETKINVEFVKDTFDRAMEGAGLELFFVAYGLNKDVTMFDEQIREMIKNDSEAVLASFTLSANETEEIVEEVAEGNAVPAVWKGTPEEFAKQREPEPAVWKGTPEELAKQREPELAVKTKEPEVLSARGEDVNSHIFVKPAKPE